MLEWFSESTANQSSLQSTSTQLWVFSPAAMKESIYRVGYRRPTTVTLNVILRRHTKNMIFFSNNTFMCSWRQLLWYLNVCLWWCWTYFLILTFLWAAIVFMLDFCSLFTWFYSRVNSLFSSDICQCCFSLSMQPDPLEWSASFWKPRKPIRWRAFGGLNFLLIL